MTGIIFGLFSIAWILFTSMLYHIRTAKKSMPSTALLLKKRARHFGALSMLLFAAAVLLNYN